MAATQAESQQNEINREQVHQDQPPDISNSVLQNGTEKTNLRGIVGPESVVNPKGKPSGPNSIAIEMSQYRQESGSGPPIHNSSGNSDQNVNSGVENNKVNLESKPFQQNVDESVGVDPSFGKVSDNGQNVQGFSIGFSGRINYHSEQTIGNSAVQNSAEGSNVHTNHPFGQFNTQSMRFGFPGSKPRPPNNSPINNSPSGSFPPHGHQQRFLSGQSISQQTGPTPTLNQLLQSSNPVHRYQNSLPNNYGDFNIQKSSDQASSMPYNQSWPSQRPLASYNPQQSVPGYRNQAQTLNCLSHSLLKCLQEMKYCTLADKFPTSSGRALCFSDTLNHYSCLPLLNVKIFIKSTPF